MMGKTYAPRPTVYRGHRMRSRLEAGFAAWLDQWQFDWEYEPCAFGHPEHGQYLPDFLLKNVPTTWRGRINLYVEVKPGSHWPDEVAGDISVETPYDRASINANIVVFNEPSAALAYAIPERDGAEMAEVHLMALQRGFRRFYWPEPRIWIPALDGEGCAAPPLALAEPLWRCRGPWQGDWWKGQGG